MLTIKILFTINSLKKNYFVKRLFTIPFVKKMLSFDSKKLITLLKQKLFKLRQSLKKNH